MAIPEGYTPLAKIGIAYKGNYVAGTAYRQLDAVYYGGSTYLALIDNPTGYPTNDGVNWRYLAQGAGTDISDASVNFTEAAIRENIATGDSTKTIMGKIKKWFTDMTAAAFAQMLTSYPDLMANTVSGYLVDALAVKAGFEDVNSNLSNIGKIISNATTSNLNTTSGTMINIINIWLPKGTYIVLGHVYFDGDSSIEAVREGYIYNNTTGTYSDGSRVKTASARLLVLGIVTCTTSEHIILRGRQYSGVSETMAGTITAIRIC